MSQGILGMFAHPVDESRGPDNPFRHSAEADVKEFFSNNYFALVVPAPESSLKPRHRVFKG